MVLGKEIFKSDFLLRNVVQTLFFFRESERNKHQSVLVSDIKYTAISVQCV